MTKKEALKIIKLQYGNCCTDEYIDPLCDYLNWKLRRKWCQYWYQIENDINSSISNYFISYSDFYTLSSFTRLLTLHMFIEDVYHD
jgi:hypothetical protein